MSARTKLPVPLLSRRRLLRNGSIGVLVAPFLPRARAFAQPGGPANLLVVTFPEGLETGWQPTVTGGAMVFNDTMSALDPFKNDLVLVNGLKGGTNNLILAHGEGPLSLWTGSMVKETFQDLATSPSIDQLIARKIGGDTPVRSLHLGVQTNRKSSISKPYMHYTGPKQPIPAEDDPLATYKLLVASLGGNASADRLRTERRSVLDVVKAELTDVQPLVAAEDRVKVDEHLERLRGLEKALDGGALVCGAPATPPITGAEALKDEQFTAVTDLQIGLGTAALQCGLTRVVTLQLSNTDSQTHLPGLKTTRGVHEAQHSGTAAERIEINRYFVQRIATLLGRLKAVSMGGGATLLDRTLVVIGSEMAVGGHLNDPIPFMLAGGGGYFKAGRYVKLPSTLQHTKLLTSVVQAFGLTDMSTVGEFTTPESRGPLVELRG